MRFQVAIDLDIHDAGPAFIQVVAESAAQPACDLVDALYARLGVAIEMLSLRVENLDVEAVTGRAP